MTAIEQSIDVQTLKNTPLSTEEALLIYDSLPAVTIAFMIGRWKGSEVVTGHPMDGILEATGWYGKYFIDENTVHPLLFYKNEVELYSVNPKRLPMGMMNLNIDLTRIPALSQLLNMLRPFIKTTQGKARLRMVEFRGKSSAAMCYDERPINDCFRKLDENTVLGVMDQKGGPQPYFFLLERDDESPLKVNL